MQAFRCSLECTRFAYSPVISLLQLADLHHLVHEVLCRVHAAFQGSSFIQQYWNSAAWIWALRRRDPARVC